MTHCIDCLSSLNETQLAIHLTIVKFLAEHPREIPPANIPDTSLTDCDVCGGILCEACTEKSLRYEGPTCCTDCRVLGGWACQDLL